MSGAVLIIILVCILVLVAAMVIVARGRKAPREATGGAGEAKARLMRNLKRDVYTRVAPSKIAGVGVVAIRDIPAGVNPFKPPAGTRIDRRTVGLSEQDLTELPPPVKALIRDFIAPDENGRYPVPRAGQLGLDMTFYLNDGGRESNLAIVSDPRDDFLGFRAKHPIPAGTELTIDYARYGDFA